MPIWLEWFRRDPPTRAPSPAMAVTPATLRNHDHRSDHRSQPDAAGVAIRCRRDTSSGRRRGEGTSSPSISPSPIPSPPDAGPNPTAPDSANPRATTFVISPELTRG